MQKKKPKLYARMKIKIYPEEKKKWREKIRRKRNYRSNDRSRIRRFGEDFTHKINERQENKKKQIELVIKNVSTFKMKVWKPYQNFHLTIQRDTLL